MASILLRQAFASDITKALMAANNFLNHSKNDTQWVNDDKVNLPHAGTLPTVAKNRSTKGVAVKRTDAASQYSLNELSTTPTWLQYSEELLVNYNKRQSVLEAHKDALIDGVADNVLHDWAAGGDSESTGKPTGIITTSTEYRPVQIEKVGSVAASGTRYRIAYADILNVITALNRQNVPQGGRYAVITADMLADLMMLAEFKNSDYVERKPIVDAPVTFRWMGIDWYVRSKVNLFAKTTTAAGALAAAGADTSAALCAGGVFWQKDFVRKAHGSTKVFLNVDDAELYGSKMSALVRYGAIGARTDCKGIVNLVETWKT